MPQGGAWDAYDSKNSMTLMSNKDLSKQRAANKKPDKASLFPRENETLPLPPRNIK